MLLGPVDLLLLREEIILEISSSVIWLNMMDSWILGGKKSEKDFLENFILDCTFWATVEKKSLKTLAIERGSAIKFSSWMIDVGESLLLLFFIDIIDLITFQVFLMSLLLLLKKTVSIVV